jgi:inorganic phosphate transporter, PiT family
MSGAGELFSSIIDNYFRSTSLIALSEVYLINWALVIFIFLALLFDFLNGFHDSANVVATAIASRAIPPKIALAVTALAEFVGPFLFGVAVATTIGNEVVDSNVITIPLAMAALCSAIVWNIITWLLGIPSSSSHALIGGFIGAAITGFGVHVIRLIGLNKVILGLFISPVIGLLIGWFMMRQMLFLGQWTSPRVNGFFRKAQWVTAIALGLSHGTNDAQKTMGILTMGLVAFKIIPTFEVPYWVIIACATSIALGTVTGAWRLIRTMGSGFYRIRPIHAFSSQIASTIVILSAALLGGPVSTTQVISSTIVGAGAAERIHKVRWGVAGNIVVAWVLTIPTTMFLGGLFFWFLNKVF